jgi:hypothetical protein
MRKLAPVFVLLILVPLIITACSGSTKPAAARAAEDYINALVAKNSDRLSALSCANWESSALTELDSFQAVQIRLDGLACSVSGSDGANTLVTCQGKIIATYNNEDQTIDLSVRTYEVVQQGGDYLVCGYK